MSSRATGINMEANIRLGTLIHAALNTIEKITATVVTVLIASKNDLETISLEF